MAITRAVNIKLAKRNQKVKKDLKCLSDIKKAYRRLAPDSFHSPRYSEVYRCFIPVITSRSIKAGASCSRSIKRD